MLSLIFSCLLQSIPDLFDGDVPSSRLSNAITIAQEIRPSDEKPTTKREINAYLQMCWLRQEGSERNELDLSETVTPEQTCQFHAAFSKLGMIGNQEPIASDLAAIVILGGAYPSMKERVSFAKTLVQSLEQKPHVILLTGDRNLEKIRTDEIKSLDDGAPSDSRTEEDAGQYLVNNNPDFPMILVNSPKQENKKRATTADNAKALQKWLIANKIKGKILLVSTQPHGLYQLGAIQKNCQVSDIDFDVRAVPLSRPFDSKMIAVCMDALARMVYTETTP